MYRQIHKDRVSEYICVRASGASERFLEFLIVLQIKRSISIQLNVKFKVILSSKSGGEIFVQAIPPPEKVGGGGMYPPSPPPPGIYASASLSSCPLDLYLLVLVARLYFPQP